MWKLKRLVSLILILFLTAVQLGCDSGSEDFVVVSKSGRGQEFAAVSIAGQVICRPARLKAARRSF
jgi:hypothetical protein